MKKQTTTGVVLLHHVICNDYAFCTVGVRFRSLTLQINLLLVIQTLVKHPHRLNYL